MPTIPEAVGIAAYITSTMPPSMTREQLANHAHALGFHTASEQGADRTTCEEAGETAQFVALAEWDREHATLAGEYLPE